MRNISSSFLTETTALSPRRLSCRRSHIWIVLGVCSLLAATPSWAADITWTNSNAGWDTPQEWSPSQVPGANDRAIFNDSAAGSSYAVGLNVSNDVVGNVLFSASYSTKGMFWKNSTNTLTVLNNFVMDQVSTATCVNTLRTGYVAVTNSSGTGIFQVGNYTDGGLGLLSMTHQFVAGNTSPTNYPTLIANSFLVTSNSTFTFTAGTLTTYGGSIDRGTNVTMTSFAAAAGDIATWNVLGGTNSISYLGSTGTNQLALTSGGTVNLNVSGADTLLNAGGALLSIGYNGFVSLVVSNGGHLANTGSATISDHGASASNNAVIVTGTGSMWSSSGELWVGNAAKNNTFTISAGGVVSNTGARVGEGAGSSNNVITVTGANSLWEPTAFISVGDAAGGNSLIISNSGQVFNAGTFSRLGRDSTSANNTMIVDGVGSSFVGTNGVFSAGNNGPLNNVTVKNGGQIKSGAVNVGAGSTSASNSVVVTGTNSLWTAGGNLSVSGGGIANQVTLTNGGEFLVNGTVDVGPTNTANNNIVVSGGILIATNSVSGAVLRVGGGGTTSTFTLNSGTVTVDQLMLTNGSVSVFNFNGGVLNVKTSVVANSSAFVVGNGSSAATLTLLAFSHSYANGLTISSNATLAGVGTITGNVTILGTLAPGFSPGTITMNNNLVLSNSAIVSYDLGTNSDLTVVGGNLTLGGTLNISDAGGFGVGTYTLFTYAGSLTYNNGLTIGTTPNTNLFYAINTNTANTVKLNVTYTAPAGPITGSSTATTGDSGVTYSISSVSGATNYTWTVPSGATVASGQGSTSITVNFGCSASSGNVTVTPSNTSGSGPFSSLAVIVSPVGAAGSITGSASVNTGDSSVSYSISSVSGATTYTWTVPSGATIASGQGSTSITVNYSCAASSGAVMVTPSNGGCNGTANSLGVTVTDVGAAGSISGSASVCTGQTSVAYSISSVSGATTYTWIVPSGATVASGQGTTSVTINWGSTGGNVTVTPANANACTGASASLSVTINAAPNITFSPSPQTVCTGGTANFSVTASGAGLSYQWRKGGSNISDGGSISGSGTASLTVSNATVGDSGASFDCVVSGTCNPPATSGAATLTVSPASVGGTASVTASSVCLGDSTTVTLSGSVGAIQWQFSIDNATFANINNATNATVSTGSLVAPAYYRAVVVSSPCSAATSTVASVTINTNAPSIAVQPLSTNVCQTSSADFSVSASGNGSLGYAWRKRGTGWPNGWALNNGGGGFFMASSTGNDNSQPASNGGNDIDTGGRSWGMYNTNGVVTEALRPFPAALGMGQTFSIDMDNGDSVVGTVGFGLQDSGSGSNRLEIYFVGGRGDYTINDANGEHDSGVPFTWAGINVLFRLTSSNTYAVTITRYIDGAGASFAGTLNNAGSVDRLRLFDANGAGGSANDLYFNNLRVASADDNAADAAYSGGWNNGNNGGQVPLVNGGDIANASTSTLTISPAAVADSGSYDVSVSDACGLVSISSAATLTVNPTPATPTANNNGPICAGSTLSLSATSTTAGVSYSWTGPNGFSSNAQNPSIANATTAASGTYLVTVTDGNGCTSAAGSTSVTVNPNPATPTASNNGPICAGSALSLSATSTTAGVSYSWTGPNGFSSNAQNPSIANATTAASGTYLVTVTDGNGCTSAAGSTSVTVNPNPATPTASNNGPICAGSALSLSATSTTAGVSYSWTGPNGFSSNAQNPSIANATTAASGTYLVTVTDGNGCTSAAGSTSATVNPTPATPVVGSNSPIHEGDTLNLTASTVAGVAYGWTGPNGFSSSAQNPSIANATAAASGTYSVTVTDSNGCTATASTTALVSVLRVTSIARQGTDILISWIGDGGTTNQVQVTPGTADGSYSNNYSDIGPQFILPNPDSQISTNYLEAGGSTNAPSRYYRVRLVP